MTVSGPEVAKSKGPVSRPEIIIVGDIMPRVTFDIQQHRIGVSPREISGNESVSRTTKKPASGDNLDFVTTVAPAGFIDSANFPLFEKALERAASHPARFSILDLSRVHYLNSTGISAIIRQFGIYRERKGLLVLAAVPRSVGLSMHLLGVTSFISFHKETSHAEEYLREVIQQTPEDAKGAKRARESAESWRRVFVPLRRVSSPFSGSRVLLVTPANNRFVRILRRRFHNLNGQFHIAHDTKGALASIQEARPHVVVLDSRMDPGGDFVTELKMHPGLSLISVIKIYPPGSHEAKSDLNFKVWENDYLIDPFEILELFSLTEAELIRVPKDSKVFYQQIRFQFRITEGNVERANRLNDLLIQGVLESEEDRTAMYAAIKEGLDNAVFHGNNKDVTKTVDINFLIDRTKLTVIIQDEGRGFDFLYYLSNINNRENFNRARRQILEEGRRGGLGIILMHHCTDRIEYSGSGNTLRLEKNL